MELYQIQKKKTGPTKLHAHDFGEGKRIDSSKEEVLFLDFFGGRQEGKDSTRSRSLGLKKKRTVQVRF